MLINRVLVIGFLGSTSFLIYALNYFEINSIFVSNDDLLMKVTSHQLSLLYLRQISSSWSNLDLIHWMILLMPVLLLLVLTIRVTPNVFNRASESTGSLFGKSYQVILLATFGLLILRLIQFWQLSLARERLTALGKTPVSFEFVLPFLMITIFVLAIPILVHAWSVNASQPN